MFASFARRDQRGKGELYLRGLMLDGQRKSMQPMGQRLGVDHQQLQQFVSSSTWDHSQVRARLATWAQDTLAPEAHVIDDVGFVKDGLDSPGVARGPAHAPPATAQFPYTTGHNEVLLGPVLKVDLGLR